MDYIVTEEDVRPSTVEEVLAWVTSSCLSKTWIFRGQADSNWRLFPSVARPDPAVNPTEIQDRVLRDLKLRLPSVYQRQLKDDWELLALAQHHGAPTLLLDWSRSPLIALWFAISEKARSGAAPTDAAMWALQTKGSDFLADDERARILPRDIDKTCFFEAPYFDARLAAQQGLFSVHKWWEKGGRVVPLDGHKNLSSRLKKLVIPHEHHVSMLKQLLRFGVGAASIFPDLEGLCKHLLIMHRLEPKHYQVNLSDTVNVNAQFQ